MARSEVLTRRVDVLVAGAGPAGLVTGKALASYGVDVLVVDKRGPGAAVSRALVVSTRTMELLRRFGLEADVLGTAVDVLPCAWVTSDLSSSQGTEQPLGYPVGADAARVSPTRAVWAPQDRWEPLLRARLAGDPCVVLRALCEVEAVAVDEDAVSVTLADRAGGVREVVRATYLVGADGAHSVVRRHVGIEMAGPGDLAQVDRVEFEADLVPLLGGRRYGLTVLTAPGIGGALAPRGSDDQWSITRDAGATPRLTELSPDGLVGYVRRFMGAPSLSVHVTGLRTFRFAAQLATTYRRGRVFLAGDAAHRMTPRGGTGMNTAVQDGFDLGWKLGFVLNGWSSAALLDTYESERRPIAAHNMERSARTDGAAQSAAEALPWDLDGRVEHHWVDPTTSTVDLPGHGLTLMLDRDACRPDKPADAGPVDVHVLDPRTTAALGVDPTGGVLVRPDGKLVRSWRHLPATIDPYQDLDRGRLAASSAAARWDGGAGDGHE